MCQQCPFSGIQQCPTCPTNTIVPCDGIPNTPLTEKEEENLGKIYQIFCMDYENIYSKRFMEYESDGLCLQLPCDCATSLTKHCHARDIYNELLNIYKEYCNNPDRDLYYYKVTK